MSAFELQTGDTINAYDAGLQPETEGDLDTFDASTSGPNRITVWVPTEHVTVNVGAAVFGSSGTTEKSGAPEVDAGVVVQTDNHVHFHTFGQASTVTVPGIALNPNKSLGSQFMQTFVTNWADDQPVTMPLAAERGVLRLGSPLHVVTADGNYGSQQLNHINTPTEIGSAYPPPFQSWPGYGMITEGGSYQESWGNNLIATGYGDLRLAGFRTLILGSPGDVEVVADGNTISDVIGSTDDGTSISATGKWATEKKGWIVVETVNTILATIWVSRRRSRPSTTWHTLAPPPRTRPDGSRSAPPTSSGWREASSRRSSA